MYTWNAMRRQIFHIWLWPILLSGSMTKWFYDQWSSGGGQQMANKAKAEKWNAMQLRYVIINSPCSRNRSHFCPSTWCVQMQGWPETFTPYNLFNNCEFPALRTLDWIQPWRRDFNFYEFPAVLYCGLDGVLGLPVCKAAYYQSVYRNTSGSTHFHISVAHLPDGLVVRCREASWI